MVPKTPKNESASTTPKRTKHIAVISEAVSGLIAGCFDAALPFVYVVCLPRRDPPREVLFVRRFAIGVEMNYEVRSKNYGLQSK